MVTIHVIAWVSLLLMAAAVLRIHKLPRICSGWTLAAVFAGAFVLRCVLGYLILGYAYDLECYSIWAVNTYYYGFHDFYTWTGFETDYPPVYLYALYFVGGLLTHLKLVWYSGWGRLLLKLPAICCDVASGGLLFGVAKKHLSRDQALWLTALYLFNPTIILNSAVWGQVDTIMAFEAALMCLFLSRGMMPAAYVTFGIGILTKPQMPIFAPILLLGIWENVFSRGFSWKKFCYNLFAGLGAIGIMALICLPFGVGRTISQYFNTLDAYGLASQNAANLWTMLGRNMGSQDERILFLTCRQWGTLFIVLSVAATVWLFLRMRENAARYYICAAFLMASVFLLAVRMHERYMYPVLILLALSCAVRLNRGRLLTYVFFTFTQFYNTGWVLAVIYWDRDTYNAASPLLIAVSVGAMLTGAWFVYTLIKEIREDSLQKL